MAGFKAPSNKVVVAGTPIIQSLKVRGTLTEMKPGRFVIRDTTDAECSIAGAAALNSIGVLGYEQAHASVKPATIDTAYGTGAEVPVLSGPIVVRAYASEAITKGAKVVLAANGQVANYPGTPAAGDDRKVVGKAQTTTTGAGVILVELTQS